MPDVEIVGEIGGSLDLLASKLAPQIETNFINSVTDALTQNKLTVAEGVQLNGTPVHPLRIIHELQK